MAGKRARRGDDGGGAAMTNASTSIVHAFRGLRALVIGDAMLDSYLEGIASRLCSEGPVPVVRKTRERRLPGGGANTAANIRALGADVLYLGVVGRDAAAATLRGVLRDLSIDDRWLVEDPTVDTLHKLRILADGQYVVRFDEGSAPARRGDGLSMASEAGLLERLPRLFARADVVVVSDYGYGAAPDALIAALTTLRADAARSGRLAPLLVDSKELDRFAAAGATVVTPNHLEAQLAVGRVHPSAQQGDDLDHMAGVGHKLLGVVDASYAAVTLGAHGVLLVGRDGVVAHTPAHPAPHAHDIGAGDSFAAAMALALGAGASASQGAEIGVDAAGIAVRKQWTSVVTQQELLQRVSLRDHRSDDGPRTRERVLEDAVETVVVALAAVREAGGTIVFTNGVFDVLNAGHVRFLRQAKSLGDVLVVGVNTDRGAAALTAGGGPQNTPLVFEDDRLALVAALDPVDHAVLFDERTPADLIRALRPHIHVKGGDYTDEALPEAEAVRDVGGCVVIVPLAEKTQRPLDRDAMPSGTTIPLLHGYAGTGGST